MRNMNRAPQVPDNEANAWDALKEVEYAGDTNIRQGAAAIEKAEKAEDAVQRLRDLTNWTAKAKADNPEGLAAAVEADNRQNSEKRRKKQEIHDGVAQYRKLEAESETLDRRQREIYALQNTKKRSLGYRIKQKIGLHDAQFDEWNEELAQIAAQRQETVDLVRNGFAISDEVIQERIGQIGSETHDEEEAFVQRYVAPLEKEQKRELLAFDNLAELTTEEYLNLWRGLNPYYLSHVTRQGYRDHTGMLYHTAGSGEFHDNFKDILASGKKLHSAWESATGQGMSSVGDEAAVAKYLQQKTFLRDGVPENLREGKLDEATLAGALGRAHQVLNQPDNYWKDRASVHFMANAVGDKLYGAEEDNEVFFVFPADVLASQCYYTEELGSTEDYAHQSERKMVPVKYANAQNDFSVMPRENGIPLDAGLVFLPKNIFVNPENGSKYQVYDDESPVLASEENGGIRAEEYWQQYFAEHPEAKPAHIIYYDGSPKSAVTNLLQKYGIVAGGAGDLNDGSDVYDCGWGENMTYGGTAAEQQVAQERKTFFEKMAQYIKNESAASKNSTASSWHNPSVILE